MARGDDDIENLLKQVEGALGTPSPGPAPGRPAVPAGRSEIAGRAGTPAVPAPGVFGRLRAGVPRALTAGAGCGVVVGAAFSVLPVVSPLSGSLGAFAAAVAVSLGGRLRRRG